MRKPLITIKLNAIGQTSEDIAKYLETIAAQFRKNGYVENLQELSPEDEIILPVEDNNGWGIGFFHVGDRHPDSKM